MKTIYDKPALEELMVRIEKLTPESKSLWGKMTVAQMLAHNTSAIEMALGRKNPPRALIGMIIGPFLKPIYTNDKPFSKSSPTSPDLVIFEECDFEKEKARLIATASEFSNAGTSNASKHPHPFFGKLTPEEWGIGMFNHLDHHLQQFGV